MSVDAESKKAMENILMAMNNNPDPFAIGEGPSQSEPGTYVRAAVVSEGQQAMKEILTNFYSAVDNTVDVLAETSETHPRLAEALVTERTDRGARVGSWEIVKHSGNSFDVIHADTREPIAKSLKIYEAAYALASALNVGKTLTDEPVRKILALESQYATHLEKATHFKHMAKKLTETGESKRAAIAEDRLDDARGKALDERERLMILCGLK